LRESKEVFDSLFQNMVVCVCLLDVNGIIISSNSRCLMTLGCRQEDLAGKYFFSLTNNFADVTFAEACENLREATSQAEIACCNGCVLPVMLSISQFFDGESTYFLVNFVDIKERIALQNLKQQLVSTISHDLRTPLTSVGSALELITIGAYGSISETSRVKLEAAKEEVGQLVQVINFLLEIERFESGSAELNWEIAALSEILEDCLNSVLPIAEKHSVDIEVEQCLDDYVFCDKRSLTTALTCLLTGAAEQGEGKGGSLKIRTQKDNSYLTIEIQDPRRSDSGTAFQNLVESYNSGEITTPSERQRALGLMLAKAIISRNRGVLTLRKSDAFNVSTIAFSPAQL
jgi:PAS domain S-box-containing protein